MTGLKFPKILESSFLTLIVGKPGSGKTHLIEELLLNEDFYYKKFDKILVITPQSIGKLKLPPDYWKTSVDTAWLNEKITEFGKK